MNHEMICTQRFEYPPGKFHDPGDRLEVPEEHVKLLELAGKAEPADRDTLRVKRAYTKRMAH